MKETKEQPRASRLAFDRRTIDSEDELEQAANVFRRRFANASHALPYDRQLNRTLLPPEWKKPALVVPLDGEYVVPERPVARPVPWLSDAFSAQLPGFLRTLNVVKGSLKGVTWPKGETDEVTPYLPNAFFGWMDATALSGFVGALRPRRYVEIGSGMSTRFARRAIAHNKLNTKIVCIDPAPRSSISKVADQIIRESLLDLDLSLFVELQENDILFFDGSHIVFTGTDCSRFFLEILPNLPIGVYVHIHDIFLPGDYPEHFRTRYYNEQFLLAAFLFGNAEFEVVLPVHYLHSLGHCGGGCSFWIKRIADQRACQKTLLPAVVSVR